MAITNGYSTRDIVAAELGITSPSATQQTQIDAAVNAASRQIDAYTGRRFWQDATVVTREYHADDSWTCHVDDISTTTGLIVKTDTADTGGFATTLTVTTHFILLPLNAADRVPVWPYDAIRVVDSNYSLPQFSSGRPGVQITAKFGWPAVPDDIAQACAIQAVQLFKSSQAVFGGLSFDAGILRVRDTLNPLAAALVEGYCKARVG